MVIRIMLMVPIYAIASLIALFSLEAAFVIDVIRDIYEVGYWSGPTINKANRLPRASGFCDLLFFPTPGWLYGGRTFPAYSSPRAAPEGRGVPVHPPPPRTRPERSIRLPVHETWYPA